VTGDALCYSLRLIQAQIIARESAFREDNQPSTGCYCLFEAEKDGLKVLFDFK
jgi:hypothetical protein